MLEQVMSQAPAEVYGTKHRMESQNRRQPASWRQQWSYDEKCEDKFFCSNLNKRPRMATTSSGCAEETKKAARRSTNLLLLLIYLHLLLSLTVCSLSRFEMGSIFDMFSWRQHWAMWSAGQKRKKRQNLLILIGSTHNYLLKLDTVI